MQIPEHQHSPKEAAQENVLTGVLDGQAGCKEFSYGSLAPYCEGTGVDRFPKTWDELQDAIGKGLARECAVLSA
jgi:hypothetical protein